MWAGYRLNMPIIQINQLIELIYFFINKDRKKSFSEELIFSIRGYLGRKGEISEMLKYLARIYKKPGLIIVDIILLNLALLASFFLRFDGDILLYLRYPYFVILTIIGFVVLYFSNL